MKTKNRIAVSVFITAFAFGLNITGVLPILGILNENTSNMEQEWYSSCRRCHI